MDKNTITGIILIFVIFVGFSVYNGSRLNKGFENAVKTADSEVAAGNLERARTEYVNALRFKANNPEVLAKIEELNVKLGISTEGQVADTIKAETTSNTDSISVQTAGKKDANQYGAFAIAAKGDNEFITLENNKIQLKISTKGGRIYSALLKDYKTYDSLPLILFSGDSTIFGFNFFTVDNKAVRTNNLFFKPVSDQKSYVVTDKPQTLSMRLYAGENKYIEYRYTLAPDKYSISFDVTFKNLDDIMPANQNNITLDWRMYLPQQEKGRQNEENYGSGIKFKNYQDEFEELKNRQQKEVETKNIPTRLSWVAYVDQFFSSVIITDDYFLNASLSSTRTLTSPKYIRYYTSEVGIPFTPGSESKIAMRLYFGPNHISTLRKEGLQLEKIVNLGKNIIGWINRFVIIPIFNLLNKYISNYGIIILILT